jgi:hypothetical protein
MTPISLTYYVPNLTDLKIGMGMDIYLNICMCYKIVGCWLFSVLRRSYNFSV